MKDDRQSPGKKYYLDFIRNILTGNVNVPKIPAPDRIGHEEGLLAIFFKRWKDTPVHTFVIDPSGWRSVYPALRMAFHDEWLVEPYLVTLPDLEESWGLPFQADWPQALLRVTTAELTPFLPDATATFRLEPPECSHDPSALVTPDLRPAMHHIERFWQDGPKTFFSDKERQLLWTIADEWRKWRSAKWQWGEMCLDLEKEFGFPSISPRHLQRKAKQEGLHRDW